MLKFMAVSPYPVQTLKNERGHQTTPQTRAKPGPPPPSHGALGSCAQRLSSQLHALPPAPRTGLGTTDTRRIGQEELQLPRGRPRTGTRGGGPGRAVFIPRGPGKDARSGRGRRAALPTVDLQASQKVSSVKRSIRLVLPTPREPMMMTCSLKSAGRGGCFLRRACPPDSAGDPPAEPAPSSSPPPPALRCASPEPGSISAACGAAPAPSSPPASAAPRAAALPAAGAHRREAAGGGDREDEARPPPDPARRERRRERELSRPAPPPRAARPARASLRSALYSTGAAAPRRSAGGGQCQCSAQRDGLG